MLSELAVLSYGVAATGWMVLLCLLLTSWRGRLQGGLLVIAVVINLPWALRAAYLAHVEIISLDWWYQVLEVARSVSWLIFLTHLLEPLSKETWPDRWWLWNWVVPIGFGLILLWLHLSQLLGIATESPPDLVMLGHVGLAIAGLALVEQLLRNTRAQQRWASKFLYLGTGLMFAYDFYLYTDALLFRQLSPTIWGTRGFVSAMAVPLLGIAAARNPTWSVEVFVSRRIVRYSAAVFGTGIYLLFMAASGYYIQKFGGSWGVTLHAAFLVAASVLLVVLFFSSQLRARASVLLNKHFFESKYDYREEWLRFTRTLSVGEPNEPPRTRAIRAVAEIVHGTGGLLWIRQGRDLFKVSASWNMGIPNVQPESMNNSLPHFLKQRQWVVELSEYRRTPEIYDDLILPDWLHTMRRAWLVIPLLQGEELNGFLVLTEGHLRDALNWEDRDLLKTAGRQVAGYVALLESSEALWEARQFEAFHRLSAYVVHDLKNIAAQLALVVANAGRHKANPAFVDDAFLTVANATDRMNRLLAQLRTERPSSRIRSLALSTAAQQAVKARSAQQPKPVLHWEPSTDPWVRVDPERLTAVLEHLIQNAQEATPPTGHVDVEITAHEKNAVIVIRDDGCGMDDHFLRERLFRPFTTTKGNAGMGIGVYESYEFARGAGGDLTVESAPGKGTRFFLHLPRVDHATAA